MSGQLGGMRLSVVAGHCGCLDLTKSALSPGRKLAGSGVGTSSGELEDMAHYYQVGWQVSVQSFLPQMALCLYWEVEEENGTCQFSCFHRSPPTHSNIIMKRSVSHLPLVLYKLLFLCCLSMHTAASLRAAAQLSLASPACPVS